MAVFDAEKEGYELGEMDGKMVAFTNMRIDRDTVPEELYCYDIRDSDRLNGSCAEIKPYVMVNHWGTILCKEPFPMNERGSYYPKEDMNYLGVSISLQEFRESTEEELRNTAYTENQSAMSGLTCQQ